MMNKLFPIFLLLLSYHPALVAQQVDTTYYDEERTMIKEIYTLQNGVPHGQYTRYYLEEGLAEQGNFEAGRRHGLYVSFFPNSTDTLRSVHFANGRRAGQALSYLRNGNAAQEAVFIDDLLHGKVKTYYESGQLQVITPMVDDQPHGRKESFYEQGGIMETVELVNGILEGESIRYDEE